MATIQEIAQAVESGKVKIVGGLVEAALNAGLDPVQILNQGMIGAMDVVGERFKRSEIFVPEMLVAAKAMKKGVEVLKPKLTGAASIGLGTCIIGTVAGDLHDIGKNLVAMMIESAGFTVIDLGVDISGEKFIDALRNNPNAKLLALSALLTTTMPSMQQIIEAVKAANLTGFKIIVGGAPITPEFAKQIGADGYAPDAASAAALAKQLAA